jgi:uncharacterized protein YndB with AHSA1/START domain
MTAKPNFVAEGSTDREIIITRVFDAPRELVFEAWTNPEHLLQWFAPRGCTIHFAQLALQPGGGFHSCIRTPDFHDCWCQGSYHEIVPPERIVFSMAVADEKGNLVTPVDAGMAPEWPKETTVTVTFEDEAGKTRLTLHQTVSESLAKRTGAYPSWLQMLDRLGELLQTKAGGVR